MRKKIILIVTVMFMLLTTMFLPMTNGNNTIHAETTSVSTWQELRTAVSNAVDGDVIVIKADLVADESITLDKDNISIKIQSDGTHYIYRKKRDTYDSMFIVKRGQLTLGDGLVLSGKIVNCEKGSAQAIDDNKPNNYKRDDYKKQETSGPTKAKFGNSIGNLAERGGTYSGAKQINIYSEYPNALEFEIVDIVVGSETRAVLKVGDEYVNNADSRYIYKLSTNIDKVLMLKNKEGNFISASDIENDGEYIIYDSNWQKDLIWDTNSNPNCLSSNDGTAVIFTASDVSGGGSGATYWMIPNEVPITDSGRVRCDTEEEADAAIKQLNEVIDPIPYKYVPETDKDLEENRYYNDGNGNWINSANVNINDAMDAYNTSHTTCTTACPINNTNNTNENIYTNASFTGKVGDGYTPKGFFVHVEGGKAILDGATLENFITSREKDTSPKFVAPVVANGTSASFDVVSGYIKNNTVGYIVKDEKAYESADQIKAYIKGGAPNAARIGEYAKRKYRRNSNAGIDVDNPGSGITATAGAIIYAGGAQGSISGGYIELNRGDTGGIMATGEDTKVNLLANADISKNVGVQFGGGITTESGAFVLMQGGEIHENVAWFGGGGVYATENGVQWLLGKTDIIDRQDGKFVMDGGTIDSNTAFTRGGGFFVDSDGVTLNKGVISNNMSRMIGGGMYVMGDDKDFTYTVYISEAYVHENKAISAGKTNEVASDSDNQILSRKLVEPCGCDATITSLFNGQMEVNSDDLKDGYPRYPHEGSDGTGGGIWLCAYGNTVLNVDDDSVIIDNNYASGSVLRGKATQDNQVIEQISSNKAGGNDIHKETKGPGNIVFFGIKDNIEWHDENTGELYTDPAKAKDNSITDFTERNLTNLGTYTPDNYNLDTYRGVNVFGNISRRGGGLAADGTFVFGKPEAIGEAYSELAVTKTWTGGTTPEDVTIRIKLQYEDEKGNEKTINVIELPLSDVVNTNASELDTAFTDGKITDADGNVVYLGHVVLPITVEDENGNQIQLFDLLSDQEIQIDKIGRNVPSGEKETIPAGYTFELNKAYGLIALGRYLKERGTVTLSNAKRKLTFTEVKYDSDGKEIEVKGYELTPSEMKIASQPTFREKDVFQIKTDGSKEKVGTVITSDVRFEAALYNDKPAEIEKYVNKAVHKDIELDEEFEYDIIAYVKHGTDKLVIEDQLVEDLEFVSTKSNVKVVSLDENNHLPANNITGEPVNGNASVSKEGSEVANKTVDITDNKLTVTIENKLDEIKDAKDNVIGYKNTADGQNLTALWGKWVKVTYKARVKKTLQNNIKNGKMSISDLQSITIKDSDTYKADNSIYGVDELRPTPNAGNDPVKTDEDHTGIVNTASYTLEVKNNPKFRDESNTVTVKPTGDYKKIDVEKIWDDSNNSAKKRPSSIKVVLYKDGDKYKEAILNEDNSWKYSFTGLPEDGEYKVEEEKVEYYLTNIEGDSKQGFKIKNIYREYFPDREFDVDQCGEYVLTKNGSGNISKNTEFTFNVTMIIDKGLSTEKTYKDTLKLKVGESKTYDFVVADTQITVEEVSSDNYDVTYYLDDEKVTETMTIICKGKTSNFEIFNSSKEKPPIPKTGIE